MFLSPLFDTYLILLLMRLLGLQLPDAGHHLYVHGGRRQHIPGDADDRKSVWNWAWMRHRFKLAFKYLAIRYGFSLIFLHPDRALPAGINGREDDPLHAVLFADRIHGDRIHRRSGRGRRNLRLHEFRLHPDRDLRDAVRFGGYGITKYRIFAFVLLVSVNQVGAFAVGIVTLGLCSLLIQSGMKIVTLIAQIGPLPAGP